MNAIERSAILIANKQFRFAGRSYNPGDKFDHKRAGHAQRRKIIRLIDGPERKLVELTAKSMESALKRREEGARPPRGFTLDGLVAWKILTEEQIKTYGWASESRDNDREDDDTPWIPVEGSWRVFPEGRDEEKDVADALWVVPFKTGQANGRGPVRYHVHDFKGANLNGAASIAGKAQAEDWARNWMAERDARRAQGDQEMDWSGFSENPDEWTDEQVEAFSAWYDAAPVLDEAGEPVVYELPAGVAQAFKERRDAKAQEDEVVEESEEDARFANMTEAENREFVEGLSEEDLRAFVAAQQGKEVAELAELAPVALIDLAVDIIADKKKTGAENGSDVSTGTDPAA